MLSNVIFKSFVDFAVQYMMDFVAQSADECSHLAQ